jgi:peptidoglycan hydrolase-like protein with peptidoglycan-binding domain
MYDGVTAASIPVGPDFVAGYVDGRFAWSPSDWARHSGAFHVRIAVSTANLDQAHVLDVELGDASPAQAAAARAKVVYCNRATMVDVQREFRRLGIPQPLIWMAWWDGNATVPPGVMAKQFRNNPGYDESVIATVWPGVEPQLNQPVTYPGYFVTRGAAGGVVRLVQRALGVAADGMFGPITQRAVQAAQSKAHLANDGIVGPLTWAALKVVG